jgi:hypothetical protein
MQIGWIRCGWAPNNQQKEAAMYGPLRLHSGFFAGFSAAGSPPPTLHRTGCSVLTYKQDVLTSNGSESLYLGEKRCLENLTEASALIGAQLASNGLPFAK